MIQIRGETGKIEHGQDADKAQHCKRWQYASDEFRMLLRDQLPPNGSLKMVRKAATFSIAEDFKSAVSHGGEKAKMKVLTGSFTRE